MTSRMASFLFLAFVVAVVVFLLVAVKLMFCWVIRGILGIPKDNPPYRTAPEPQLQDLPWYLDDRVPPPN